MARRIPAAPFVIVIALLPACGPPPEPISRNPPAPEPTEHATPPDPEPTPPTNPPVPEPAPTAGEHPSPDNSHIVKRDDGTCWKSWEEHCPEGASCNPPPPQKVECPK